MSDREDKTPRTSAALSETLDNGFDLGPQHQPLVTLCRALESALASERAKRAEPVLMHREPDDESVGLFGYWVECDCIDRPKNKWEHANFYSAPPLDQEMVPDLSMDLELSEALCRWYESEKLNRRARGGGRWGNPTQEIVELIARKLRL